MELIANIWPVVDARTGIVLRYFARAYAIAAPDEVIREVLRALAPTDFRIAQMFTIPRRLSLTSEHGTIVGAVDVAGFQAHSSLILESAFRELETGFAPRQGLAVEGPEDGVAAIGIIPRFSEEPYLMFTALLEMPDGRLVPQVSS